MQCTSRDVDKETKRQRGGTEPRPNKKIKHRNTETQKPQKHKNVQNQQNWKLEKLHERKRPPHLLPSHLHFYTTIFITTSSFTKWCHFSNQCTVLLSNFHSDIQHSSKSPKSPKSRHLEIPKYQKSRSQSVSQSSKMDRRPPSPSPLPSHTLHSLTESSELSQSQSRRQHSTTVTQSPSRTHSVSPHSQSTMYPYLTLHCFTANCIPKTAES